MPNQQVATSKMESTPKDSRSATNSLFAKVQFFQVHEMHLYDIGGMFYAIVGVVTDPNLLPKVTKDDRQLVGY